LSDSVWSFVKQSGVKQSTNEHDKLVRFSLIVREAVRGETIYYGSVQFSLLYSENKMFSEAVGLL